MNKSLQVYIVAKCLRKKCGLLLKYRIQANLDEKAVVFLPRKSFCYPFAWVKKLVFFIIIFLWEKITNKFQCHNILWNGGYFLSKDQENILAQGCATFFVGGPYNQLQTSSWATRKI